MAERTISEREGTKSERSELREREWAVAKTLLDANAHTVQAFEYHLLRAYREDASPNPELIRSNLSQAIDKHEKIIGNLEAARRAVVALEDERD